MKHCGSEGIGPFLLEFPGFFLRPPQYLSEKVSFTGYLGLTSVTMTFKLAISENPTIKMKHERITVNNSMSHIITCTSRFRRGGEESTYSRAEWGTDSVYI